MTTSCRVWHLYHPRCMLCEWSGELTNQREGAAYDARAHRASPEHKRKLREARARRKEA